MGIFKKTGQFLENIANSYKESQRKSRIQEKKRLNEEIELEKERLKLDKLKAQRNKVRPDKGGGFFDTSQSEWSKPSKKRW